MEALWGRTVSCERLILVEHRESINFFFTDQSLLGTHTSYLLTFRSGSGRNFHPNTLHLAAAGSFALSIARVAYFGHANFHLQMGRIANFGLARNLSTSLGRLGIKTNVKMRHLV